MAVRVKMRGGKKARKVLTAAQKAMRGGFKLGFPKSKSGNSQYPDGTDLIVVAVSNELGTKTIPPRPFLRGGAKKFSTQDVSMRKRIFKGMVRGAITRRKALSLMGLQAQSRLDQSIVELDDPANAASTIRQKGSSNPLIDTGRLRQAATHEVF